MTFLQILFTANAKQIANETVKWIHTKSAKKVAAMLLVLAALPLLFLPLDRVWVCVIPLMILVAMTTIKILTDRSKESPTPPSVEATARSLTVK